MISKTFAVCAAVLTLSVLSGCGTVVNIQRDNPKVYGGVREMGPLGWGFCFHNDSSPEHPDPVLGGLEFCIGTYFLVVETPLSAVGDTLTLPYVLCRRLGEQSDAAPAAMSEAKWEEVWKRNHQAMDESPPANAVMPTAASRPASP